MATVCPGSEDLRYLRWVSSHWGVQVGVALAHSLRCEPDVYVGTSSVAEYHVYVQIGRICYRAENMSDR
jgi:hypothetical protein